MNYGGVSGVEKAVARTVQGAVGIRAVEERLDFALLDGVFAILGCNAGEEFEEAVATGGAQLTPGEVAWLGGGGGRPSSA